MFEVFDTLEHVSRGGIAQRQPFIQIKLLFDSLMTDPAFLLRENLVAIVRAYRAHMGGSTRAICANVIIPLSDFLAQDTTESRGLVEFLAEHI